MYISYHILNFPCTLENMLYSGKSLHPQLTDCCLANMHAYLYRLCMQCEYNVDVTPKS